MIDIFASGNDVKAHLGVPAEDDLRRSLSVLFAKFCEYRFTDQGFVSAAEAVHSNSWLLRVFRLQYVEDCDNSLRQTVCGKPFLYFISRTGCITACDGEAALYDCAGAGLFDIAFTAAHAAALIGTERKDGFA